MVVATSAILDTSNNQIMSNPQARFTTVAEVTPADDSKTLNTVHYVLYFANLS